MATGRLLVPLPPPLLPLLLLLVPAVVALVAGAPGGYRPYEFSNHGAVGVGHYPKNNEFNYRQMSGYPVHIGNGKFRFLSIPTETPEDQKGEREEEGESEIEDAGTKIYHSVRHGFSTASPRSRAGQRSTRLHPKGGSGRRESSNKNNKNNNKPRTRLLRHRYRAGTKPQHGRAGYRGGGGRQAGAKTPHHGHSRPGDPSKQAHTASASASSTSASPAVLPGFRAGPRGGRSPRYLTGLRPQQPVGHGGGNGRHVNNNNNNARQARHSYANANAMSVSVKPRAAVNTAGGAGGARAFPGHPATGHRPPTPDNDKSPNTASLEKSYYTKVVTLPGAPGRRPRVGDTVAVWYRGMFQDGRLFDTNIGRSGRGPLTFRVGTGRVIRGWDEVLLTMTVGEKATVTIQPEWAYGKAGKGNGRIPPNAVLVFEMQLESIQ